MSNLWSLKPTVSGMDDQPVEHRKQIAEYVNTIPRMFAIHCDIPSSGTSKVIPMEGITPEFEVMVSGKTFWMIGTWVIAVAQINQIVVIYSPTPAAATAISLLVVGPRSLSVA